MVTTQLDIPGTTEQGLVAVTCKKCGWREELFLPVFAPVFSSERPGDEVPSLRQAFRKAMEGKEALQAKVEYERREKLALNTLLARARRVLQLAAQDAVHGVPWTAAELEKAYKDTSP